APFVAWKSKRLPIWRGAYGFRQRSDEIGSEGAPNLDPECRLGAPPKDDLRFVENRSGRHADGEGRYAQVERAAGADRARGDRAADVERKLAMRDVDEAMGDRLQRRFDLRSHDLRADALGDQQPFVRSKPEGGSLVAFACRSERENRGPEGSKMSSSGSRGAREGSDIEARAVLVIENRRRDRHGQGVAWHRSEEFLTHTRAPGRDERQCDGSPHRRAAIGRCHMAERRRADGWRRGRRNLGALLENDV